MQLGKHQNSNVAENTSCNRFLLIECRQNVADSLTGLDYWTHLRPYFYIGRQGNCLRDGSSRMVFLSI